MDLECLQEARQYPQEWAEIQLPLHIKHCLARQLQSRQGRSVDGLLGILPNCLLSTCCGFLGPEQTARLQQSSRCWRQLVEGKDFEELWRKFLTESGELLQSFETDARRSLGARMQLYILL